MQLSCLWLLFIFCLANYQPCKAASSTYMDPAGHAWKSLCLGTHRAKLVSGRRHAAAGN